MHDKPIIDHTPNNLNPFEKLALASLLARRDITIKPADKGGSIVVMDTVKYERGIIRQLSDDQSYAQLDFFKYKIELRKL